jgi:protein TonB
MPTTQGPETVPVGHLSVHLDDRRPGEVLFNFERQGKRMQGALGASFLTHIAFVGLIVLAIRFSPTPDGSKIFNQPDDLSNRIIFLATPGPGGGGGGGGNKSPEPPRKAELPGRDKITVPVAKKPDLEKPVEKPPDKEPEQALSIPAKTLAAAIEPTVIPGAIEGNGPTVSLGTGTGGGAGTGTGTGIGSGTGSGLGEGFGGGTGGGAYRPGSGVESPRLLRDAKPQYTADAMRAKIQGRVEIECIVEPTGQCGRIQVVRSLDPVFGLDQEAIKAVRQWRFVPGRYKGQEVPVIITIELTFTLR